MSLKRPLRNTKNQPYGSVSDLLADTGLSYAAGSGGYVDVGDFVEAGGFRYTVAGCGASDHHVITAGGVRLRVVFAFAGGREIHASAFGITDSAADQFSRLNVAVQACSAARCALNIEGLGIAVGKQNTSDDYYKYVRAGNPGGATIRTYAVLIPIGGYLKLTGNGTVKNLNPDDNQIIFHGVGCDYVEIGDGVTLDGNLTQAGWGGTIHLMGVEKFHLGRCTFVNDGICRIGASTTRRSGVVTFTQPRWIDCWGTHCIGGKPGGFEEIWGDTLHFENVRGCVNLETEDEDKLNDDGMGGLLWGTKIVGHINAVCADDVNGDKDAGNPVPASVVVCSEGKCSDVRIGTIIASNTRSSLTNASCLVVGGGQTSLPYSAVSVGHIHGINCAQAVRYDATKDGGERIHIGSITGNGFNQIIKAKNSGNLDGVPEGCRSLRIGKIDVNTAAEAIYVENEDGTYPGDLIENLSIGQMRVETCTNSAGYIKDVRDVVIGDYSWGNVPTFASAKPYGNFALWIKCTRLLVSERLRSEDSHNQFLYLESDYADLRGVDQVKADAGGGITLAGCGDVILRDGQIRATGGGVAIRDARDADCWTGNLDLINFDLNGKGLDTTVVPRKVRNSDMLKTTLSAWNPGAITHGTPGTKTVTVTGAKAADAFTVRPTTVASNQRHLDFVGYFTGINTVTIAVRNLDSASARDPGSANYEIVGERG